MMNKTTGFLFNFDILMAQCYKFTDKTPNSYSAPPQLIHIEHRLLDNKTKASAVLVRTQD